MASSLGKDLVQAVQHNPPLASGWKSPFLVPRDRPVHLALAHAHRGAGADYYLEKPFSHLELLARANALTRMGGITKDGAVRAGALTINLTTYTLTRSDEEIQLSGAEWRLPSCLMQNAGKVADNRTLAREVWHSDLVDQA